MWLLVAIAVLFLALLWVFVPYNFRSLRTHRLGDLIPGPKGYPIIGALLYFRGPQEEFLNKVLETTKTYAPIWKLWVMGVPMVFVTDLEDVEKILSSRQHISKSDDYLMLEPWLCTGLLTSKGEKWHHRRKVLTPAFHFKILEDYIGIFQRNSEVLVQQIHKRISEPFIDIHALATLCTLDIICETAMGTSVNAQTEKESEYAKAVKRMSELFNERQLSPWTWRPIALNLNPMGWEQRRVLKTLHGFTEKVIAERKDEFKAAKRQNETKLTLGRKRRLALLDLLLEVAEEQGLSDEDIREEVDTFMFEGHDTTSAAISWATFMLGNHPDVQDRVMEELNDIFGDSERAATMDDLGQMRYLEMVIKETLRLYPSVPIFSRKIEVDLVVKGYTIPAGTNCPIFTYFIHRNPDIFPDPERFNPDNFLPENVQGRHPFAYLPFSAGPRNCIGQRFALLEEKMVLSTLLRNFRLQSLDKPEDVPVMMQLILRPKDGLRIKFTPRSCTRQN